jgi:hypothetical protein
MSKIFFFLHFHKSAGTSIVQLFNNYKKYKYNFNGNPWTTKEPFGINSYAIPFFNYKKDEFNFFLKELIDDEVKFVAMEWNFFKYYDEIPYDNIILITCIRNPYERFKSRMVLSQKNHYVDFINDNLKTPDNKYEATFNKFNYYTRMLSGIGDEPEIVVNDKHYEEALKNIDKFKIIILLDYPETFKELSKYNIDYSQLLREKKNKNENNINITINISTEEFIKLNNYDYMLYDYIKKKLKIQ